MYFRFSLQLLCRGWTIGEEEQSRGDLPGAVAVIQKRCYGATNVGVRELGKPCPILYIDNRANNDGLNIIHGRNQIANDVKLSTWFNVIIPHF